MANPMQQARAINAGKMRRVAMTSEAIKNFRMIRTGGHCNGRRRNTKNF